MGEPKVDERLDNLEEVIKISDWELRRWFKSIDISDNDWVSIIAIKASRLYAWFQASAA